MSDIFANFAKITVAAGHNTTDTSILLNSGDGSKLPAAPFSLVWWNASDYSDPTDDPNREIVRVTNISTDTLTITRAQESTTANNHNTSGKVYLMIQAITAQAMNGGNFVLVNKGTSKQYASNVYTLTDGATIALDWNNGNVQEVTLGGNRTFTFANPIAGSRYVIIVVQDATGSRTITWPTIKWTGGSTPALTTTAGKKDIFTLIYDGTDYLGASVLNF